MKKALVMISIVVVIMTFYTSCASESNNEKEQVNSNVATNVSEITDEQETDDLDITENNTTKKIGKLTKKSKQQNKWKSKDDIVTTKEHSTTIKKYTVVKDGTTREVTSVNYVTNSTTTTKETKHTATKSSEEKTTDPHDLEPDFD